MSVQIRPFKILIQTHPFSSKFYKILSLSGSINALILTKKTYIQVSFLSTEARSWSFSKMHTIEIYCFNLVLNHVFLELMSILNIFLFHSHLISIDQMK
jgi:hypothetical protein